MCTMLVQTPWTYLMRLIQALLCHVCVGYDIGYEIGHKIGYDIGYDIGHKIRYDIGYDIGYPGTTMTYMHWNTSQLAIPHFCSR